MGKNINEEIRNRIDQLIAEKDSELEEIHAKIDALRLDEAEAERDRIDAMERTDIDAYEAAENKLSKIKTGIRMYSARYGQVKNKEYLPEAESYEVIDALLDYEKKLDERFVRAIVKPIKELERLHADYVNEIDNTEHTIKLWTSSIRENYRSTCTTYADGTNISPVPVPVHPVYRGCDEANEVQKFIGEEKIKNIFSEKEE